MGAWQAALVVGAAVFAAVAAALGAWSYARRCAAQNRGQRLRALARGAGAGVGEGAPGAGGAAGEPSALAGGVAPGAGEGEFLATGVEAQVLAYLTETDRRLKASGGVRAWRGGGEARAGAVCSAGRAAGANARAEAYECPGVLGRVTAKAKQRLGVQLAQAGMAGVQLRSCGQAALRLAAMAGVPAVVLGAALSPAMAAFLGALAASAGVCAPFWAVGQERRARASALSHELPEMLEVCALGLRSGLTFDRSFRLYPHYVNTAFARECERAMRQTDIGFVSRAEALGSLCAGYDSALLARTLGGVEQALCRGTSLVTDLERAAEEARKQFRAEKERVVAKAPIKMMLPIGVLILPAMLLLVLGPVVLGLVQGI